MFLNSRAGRHASHGRVAVAADHIILLIVILLVVILRNG